MTESDTKCVFSGSRTEVATFLRQHAGYYYTYALSRPDGRPFYIGKGKAYRLFAHETEAATSLTSHKLNVIRQIRQQGQSVRYEIDQLHGDEQSAHLREMQLIAHWKRVHEGGCLTNCTAGGEGGSDPSPESRERHRVTLGGIADDGSDRATVNRFFLKLGQHDSIAVKPESELRAEVTQRFTHMPRKPTRRQAVTLAASAVANGIPLEPGCRIPRRMLISGVSAIVENGVARDIATSNLAKVMSGTTPADEIFLLDTVGVDFIVRTMGRQLLESAGIIEPIMKSA
jgi:hypothetical protein